MHGRIHVPEQFLAVHADCELQKYDKGYLFHSNKESNGPKFMIQKYESTTVGCLS